MLGGMVAVDYRASLFRELATLVKSGISVGEALSTLQSRPGSRALREAVSDAAKRVSTGERLSEAMEDHPKVFNRLNRALIQAGEEGGRLEEMLEESADYLEREAELRRMLSRETFYPKILIAAAILIPLGARVVIAWAMVGIGSALAVFVRSLGGYALVAGLIFVAWLAYRKFRSTKQGAETIDALKLRLPVIGPIVMQVAWAKICRAISALYRAGLTPDQALEIAGPASGNRLLQDQLQRAIPRVQKGQPISQALLATGQVPDLPMSMLKTGEKTGDLDQTLQHVADYFEDQAETSIHRLSLLIVPIAVVIMGIVVLLMAVQAYSGYFEGIMSGV